MTPRCGEATPWGCGGSSPRAPTHKQIGTAAAPGSRVGNCRRGVCAPPHALGKVGAAWLRETAGWALPGVDQHGRLRGSGNGVCWARAPPPRGRGARRRGLAGPARQAGR